MGSIPVGVTTWEHSSAGRASALQAEGHRFEPCCSHQQKHIARAVFFCCQTARTYGRFAATRTARCAPRVTADAPFLSQATSLSLFYEPCSPTNKNTSHERCFFVAKTARTYGRFAATRIARCAPRVTADAPFLSQATSLSLFYEPCPPTNKNTSQERCFFVVKRLEPTAVSRPRAPRVVPLDK